MQPEDKESPVQVTVLTRDGEDERPIGSGILVAPLVVLADETLSHELYGRPDLFPAASDDLLVLPPRPAAAGAAVDAPQAAPVPQPDTPAEPDAPVFVVELVDGGHTQRIDVGELYRSLDTPLPWVGFGLAEATDLPLSEVPAEAREGLFDPLERSNWVCMLMPKACR